MAESVLFVAREPDETLRTFLPIIDELTRRGVTSEVIFHHWPGDWAQRALEARGTAWWHVAVSVKRLAGLVQRLPMPAAARGPLGELTQLRETRSLTKRIVEQHQPRAVVVIQDTLLLERFLVRWANRSGIPTLVIQWAFSFPQDYYDRLRALKSDASLTSPRAGRRSRRSLGLYGLVQRALDVRFDMPNSYGGGEARQFAVMGSHFRDQYRAQGVTGKVISITGHPLHDAAFQRAQVMDATEQARIRASYGIPSDERLVLYATQPFFWRGVLTADELQENIRAMNTSVSSLGPDYRLAVKIHPRESIDDYAFCAELAPPVRVIASAEMTDLIALAEVFISSSSSTVLLAMMLDRPIVTVNFNQVLHFDLFESIGGTLHTRTFDEFDQALKRVTHDETTRAQLAESRSAALNRLARFDGHATERITDLLAPGPAPSPPGRGPGRGSGSYSCVD
ncbi:MAG: CDP-glycerol glycerophosphotransferase family protein [Chloroflexota bacterium]